MDHSADPLPDLTVEELDQLCADAIEELQAGIDAYEERLALQQIDDGKTTDERAFDALRRPERFNGEHDVARAWLKTSKTARLWTRNGVS